ncbi:Gfo/Idh/MocA family protein [Falsirhodobacter deserti]|uniref:Gfo/Idh/MocA family protein n=1 Tax=Falsirhodobacter deserti TaxID=1365611 RepID=UPI000FE4012F|nr:Gfo/Idh/MocA family oxidoreductase [Falsirhodobacter deserti]
MTIKLALVGLGKIARDQHLPAIAETEGLELAAIASRHDRHPDLPSFTGLHDLLAAQAVEAVTLCTPPQGRYALAKSALAAGKHVMLEKPPGATVAEVTALAARARKAGLTLFATWHSREAAGVEAAREWLATRRIRDIRIIWKEDVRQWHPGQEWIWQPGGLGVFDPGINALSIATHILPAPLMVTAADLSFPANRDAPIAAHVVMEMDGIPAIAQFDWRQTGRQTWDIEVATDGGTLRLSHGGSRLHLDGEERVAEPDREYRRLYARFADLIRRGESDVDLAPLQLVADAFLLGRRRQAEAFVE